MSKELEEAPKLPKNIIDSLMPCPCNSLHVVVCIVFSSWSHGPSLGYSKNGRWVTPNLSFSANWVYLAGLGTGRAE